MLSTLLSQGVVYATDRRGPQRESEVGAAEQAGSVAFIELESETQGHILRKVRKLCEYLPNLLLNDAALTLSAPARNIAVAVVLEARRKCCLEPIWPSELTAMVFGQDESKRGAEIEDIKAVLRYIQKSLYGEEFRLTERVPVEIPDNRGLVEFVDVTESEYSVRPL